MNQHFRLPTEPTAYIFPQPIDCLKQKSSTFNLHPSAPRTIVRIPKNTLKHRWKTSFAGGVCEIAVPPEIQLPDMNAGWLLN